MLLSGRYGVLRSDFLSCTHDDDDDDDGEEDDAFWSQNVQRERRHTDSRRRQQFMSHQPQTAVRQWSGDLVSGGAQQSRVAVM